MNTKVVSEILKKTATAKDFATYAACRTRHVRGGVSSINTIRDQMMLEGFHPIPQELTSLFKDLEKAGVGKLRGDKFKWEVAIQKVGKAAEEKPEPAPPSFNASIVHKKIVIMFDTNKEISVSFTPNLGKEEVTFLTSRLLKECG